MTIGVILPRQGSDPTLYLSGVLVRADVPSPALLSVLADLEEHLGETPLAFFYDAAAMTMTAPTMASSFLADRDHPRREIRLIAIGLGLAQVPEPPSSGVRHVARKASPRRKRT